MNSVRFDVFGIPAPQGSTRAYNIGGRARVTNAATPKHNAWRDSVANAAHEAAAELDDAPLDGALELAVVFRFPMPKSRPKRLRELGINTKTTAPDLDKLVRSVFDALQAGGLITSDAHIHTLTARKREVVGWTGATITLTG